MAPLLPVVGTLLVAAAFYAATAHVAVAWTLADQPLGRALLVGPGPAVVVVGGQLASLPAPLVVVAAVLVDAFAISVVYDQDARGTAFVTGAHLVVTIALLLALVNLWRLLVA